MSQAEDSMVQQRLDNIELELKEHRKASIETAAAIGSIKTAIDTMSSTMVEIKNSVEKTREFEAKIEESRKNDEKERDRLDQRIDEQQKDSSVFRNDVYTRMRSIENDVSEIKTIAKSNDKVRDRIWKFLVGVGVAATIGVATWISRT